MKVPYTNFKTRIGDTDAVGGCTFIGGEWKDIDTTCSSQQLPGYEEKYDEIKSLGIDEVYCISVNDAFVMNAWFRDEKIVKVKPIGDGEGVFTQGMGMLVNKPKQGFGMRSWRYSMLVDDGKVVRVFPEAGKNNASDDDDPFQVSDVDTMIKYLKSAG